MKQKRRIRGYLLSLFILLMSNDGRGQLSAPLLEWRDGIGDTTTQATVHLLAKTGWPARVSINGDSCFLYRTGIFFKTVTLQPGLNTLQTAIKPIAGEEAFFSRVIFRAEPPPQRQALPLWIDSTSVEPAESLLLQSSDQLRLSVKGAKGHAGWVDFKPAKVRVYLRREDHADFSYYQADMPLSRLPLDQEQSLQINITSRVAGQKKSTLRQNARATVRILPPERFPLVKVTRNGALLSQSLGYVRLGAPVIAELPQEVLLKSSGKIGGSWRIRLDDRDEGYIDEADVAIVPEPALAPGYYITTLSASPGAGADVVTIPWLQPVPYALFPDPSGQALHIRLYGVKSSSTWITHRENMRVVDRLTWEQIAPETYQVTVHLLTPRIWGYHLKPGGSALELRFKHPPVALEAAEAMLAAPAVQLPAIQIPADPLRPQLLTPVPAPNRSPAFGLKVAIEAGHGGANLGAIGLSGLEEKNINLDVALRLAQLCTAAGMGVIQVRETDIDMSLIAKKEKIEASDADLLISIHANSGGTTNGFLGANGTSTYYNNSFWGDFARIVYRRLLELPLQEFGCVGSFNYRVIRMSSRPAILVELAFMSHAGDEEKLFLPEFRQQLAEKILQGIEEYATFMRSRVKAAG